MSAAGMTKKEAIDLISKNSDLPLDFIKDNLPKNYEFGIRRKAVDEMIEKYKDLNN